MSSFKGLARKRSREDEGTSHLPEMPRNFRLPEMPSTFHIPEMPPPKASKSKTSAGEKGNEVAKGDEGGKRASLESLPPSENPLDIDMGWWDFPGEGPCFTTVDEQLFLGWFPFVEDDFMGFYAQNEVIWEDDLWQLKDIHEIPNQ